MRGRWLFDGGLQRDLGAGRWLELGAGLVLEPFVPKLVRKWLVQRRSFWLDHRATVHRSDAAASAVRMKLMGCCGWDV
jgi:hypothetical protein